MGGIFLFDNTEKIDSRTPDRNDARGIVSCKGTLEAFFTESAQFLVIVKTGENIGKGTKRISMNRT